MIHCSEFQGKASCYENAGPSGLFCQQICCLSRKEALLIRERKFGTALETVHVPGGRGPEAPFQLRKRPARAGRSMRGLGGVPTPGPRPGPPGAVTRQARRDVEEWEPRPPLPVSPVKVAWFRFMESPTRGGNVFVNTVVGGSRAALRRRARERCVGGPHVGLGREAGPVWPQWPILGWLTFPEWT